MKDVHLDLRYLVFELLRAIRVDFRVPWFKERNLELFVVVLEQALPVPENERIRYPGQVREPLADDELASPLLSALGQVAEVEGEMMRKRMLLVLPQLLMKMQHPLTVLSFDAVESSIRWLVQIEQLRLTAGIDVHHVVLYQVDYECAVVNWHRFLVEEPLLMGIVEVAEIVVHYQSSVFEHRLVPKLMLLQFLYVK